METTNEIIKKAFESGDLMTFFTSTYREASLENCKAICKAMQQNEDLYIEKFNRIIRDIESKNNNNLAFLSPLEFYRRVYNESVYRLNKRNTINI